MLLVYAKSFDISIDFFLARADEDSFAGIDVNSGVDSLLASLRWATSSIQLRLVKKTTIFPPNHSQEALGNPHPIKLFAHKPWEIFIIRKSSVSNHGPSAPSRLPLLFLSISPFLLLSCLGCCSLRHPFLLLANRGHKFNQYKRMENWARVEKVIAAGDWDLVE